jgi:hypothetical protein
MVNRLAEDVGPHDCHQFVSPNGLSVVGGARQLHHQNDKSHDFSWLSLLSVLVAGAGFEPATFGL